MQHAVSAVFAPRAGAGALTQGVWYVGVVVAAFLIPFVFGSELGLANDVYYAVYFGFVALALAAYVRATGTDFRQLFTRSWKVSLGLGVLSSAFVVWNVLTREDATPHPDGAYFAFTVAWRGALYGAVDALLLTAFPVAVTWGMFEGRVSGATRRAGFAVVSLVLVLVITAAYHLGYEQFREDGVGAPATGNTVISIPALASTNPLGSVVAHMSMHIAADTHAYETGVFLPPQADAD